MEGLGINLGYLLVQLFNFAIMFVVVNAWIVKPIMKMLAKRRETVAQGLEDARVAADARANAEREAKQIVDASQLKAAEIIRDATERAEKVALEVRAAADADINKSREAVMKDLEQERNRMLAELRSQVVTLSMAASHKLIGEALDEKRQKALLEEFFSGVKNGKVVLMEGEQVRGSSAEITSALPLSSDEQEIIKKDVLGSLENGAKIEFRVDPAILGGLIFRVGDRIVDRSVAGQLQVLRQSLQ